MVPKYRDQFNQEFTNEKYKLNIFDYNKKTPHYYCGVFLFNICFNPIIFTNVLSTSKPFFRVFLEVLLRNLLYRNL